MASFTEGEVRQLLSSIEDNRNAHDWRLSPSGMRWGEVVGLRWQMLTWVPVH
ncbi:hypothetical protein [Rhodococcus erythropolis]|uniref:hypothetical protein n=1 Tax=Rhodococcus erythropolis TaxID=1833 RepID=UPI001BEB2843|nr:hypothetical protein [Rhodococcus erythropolis]MBT2264630.1 hypothetical protein [Rhodococcus erythropolis]